MARQRKKGERKSVTWERLREIWSAAPAADWLALLQRIAPNQKWTRNGQTITGLCPYHDEKTPSLKLQFGMRLGKCFGCGKTITDIVQLVAKLQGSSYLAALIYLNAELKLENILGDDADKFTEFHEIEEMKKEAAVAFGKLAEEFIRDHPSYLDYMRPAAVYLEKARNVPVSMIPNLPVAIFGKPEHVKKYISEEYHSAYDKYFKEANSFRMWGDVIFWYNDSPGTISNFKLRMRAKETQAIMASVDKVEDLDPNVARTLFSKNFYIVKDPVEKRRMGVFGLHHYSRLISDTSTAAIITEGEFDALSIMVEQLKNGYTTDFPIFAGGGGSATDFSFLRECWIRTLCIVTDVPGEKKGTEIAYSWLCRPDNHRGDPSNPPIQYRIFTWPPEMANNVGDLDEAVQIHGYDFVREQIWVQRENTYLNQLPWVEEQCDQALAKLNARLDSEQELARASGQETVASNLASERAGKLREVLAYWLKAVYDKADKAMFISVYSNKTGVDLSLDDVVYNDVHDVNTMDGATRVAYDAFVDQVSIPFYESRQGVNVYCVYSRLNETYCMLSLSSEMALQTMVTQYVGMDMVDWLKRILRNAVTITPPQAEAEKYASNPTSLRTEEIRRGTVVMRKVMSMLAAACVDKGILTRIGQGIHYKDIAGNNHVYVVNGSRVFRGTYNPESGSKIEWERIRDIRDGRFYFAINNKDKWSETVNDIQDLYYGMQVDLNKTYNDILNIVDGWLFENHEIMRKYIAAWIMSLPIQLATKRVNVTFITGESTSGKTSFAQGLLGGIFSTGHEIPSILEPAKVTTNATEAYIYQAMDGSSELLNIDEAETDDTTEHNMRMKSILKLAYGVPTGGSKIGRGSAAKADVIEYTLQSPILCAAIHLPDDDTFLTRIVVLYTKKDYTRRNIADIINEKFSEQQVHELRKSITTGLIGYIPEIINRRRDLDTILSKVQTTPPVSSRFVSAVSTVLTVYEMCGTKDDPHDPIELYKDVVSANKTRLETVYTADSKSRILDSILFTKCIQASNGNISEKVSPRDLIIEGTMDDINVLNNSHCGVYCIPSKNWLVFYWRQIRTAIFGMGYSQYKNLTEGGMRESISKNKYLVGNIDKQTHKQIVNELNIVDAKTPASYSVVQMAYLRDDFDSNQMQPGQRHVSESCCPPEPPMSCYDNDPEFGGSATCKGSEDTDMDFDI